MYLGHLDYLDDSEIEMVKMDGFDDCIIGVCLRFGEEPHISYDCDKVIAKNMTHGMTYEEAVEYFEYNQLGAYVGNNTPCFIDTTCLPPTTEGV